MQHDQQTCQRGVTAALVGLGIQCALSVALLFLARLIPGTMHPASWAVLLFSLGGLALGLVLTMVFQQYRVEQVERLEAERLSTRAEGDAAEPGLFEASADELSLARKRLKNLHKWILPGTSILTGGYLIAFGLILFPQGITLLKIAAAPPQATVLAMALCAGITFLGFVGGRYLAGMGRQAEWKLLSAAGSYLMGTVGCTFLLTMGYGLAHYEFAGVLQHLAWIFPALMILIGSEMLLNVLLGIYRPRVAGEAPRPAFDSRLLGLLSSSDGFTHTLQEAINYQFGFEVTRSWFWALLGKAAMPLFFAGIGTLLVFSCVVVVEPHQQAVLTRFGQISGDVLPPGFHLKLPWPLSSADHYDVTGIHEIRVGSEGMEETTDHDHGASPDLETPILWTNEHAAHSGGLIIVASPRLQTDETISQKTKEQKALESEAKVPSVSLVQAHIPVQFRIRNLLDYVRSTQDVRQCLFNLADREVAHFMLTKTVDEIVGPDRSEAGPLLKKRIQKAADDAGLGLEIVFVGMANVHPDKNVAPAFHQTIEALQEKETQIEEALRDEIKLLTEAAGSVQQAQDLESALQTLRLAQGAKEEGALAMAEGKVDLLLRQAGGKITGMLTQAQAYRAQRINQERGSAERFIQQQRAHTSAPRVYRMHKYLEALVAGLASSKKYLVLGDRERVEFRVNLEDEDVGFSSDINPMSKE